MPVNGPISTFTDGNCDKKLCPFSLLAFDRYRSFVFIDDDVVGYAEPETSSLAGFLCGEKWLEYTVFVLRLYAYPVVRDAAVHRFIVAPCADCYFPFCSSPDSRDGVCRVDHQVKENLVELAGVAEYVRNIAEFKINVGVILICVACYYEW